MMPYKYQLIALIFIFNFSLAQIIERLKLADGRFLQLNPDGTYVIENKLDQIKRTRFELAGWLRGKTIAEVRQMLSVKPWASDADATVMNNNGTFYYPYGISMSVAKGGSLFYREFSQILWNPDQERYENFVIHFYKGKFYSIQLSPNQELFKNNTG